MIRRLHYYIRVLTLLARGRVVDANLIDEDYDRISRTYDGSFSRYMIKHSDELVNAIPIRAGWHAVDLACGTGAITAALSLKIGAGGSICSIDRSRGMLEKARERLKQQTGCSHVFLIQGDMQEQLGLLQDNSKDLVTCGWAIGYTGVSRLFRTAFEKLKSGGFLAVIENRRDTLHAVRKAAVAVMMRYPGSIERMMDLHLRLPKDASHLERMFRKAGLNPVNCWQGEEPFTFHSGCEVLDWVLSTGAGAGFNRVMAPEMKEQCDAYFSANLEQRFAAQEMLTVSHCYTAGIARKE